MSEPRHSGTERDGRPADVGPPPGPGRWYVLRRLPKIRDDLPEFLLELQRRYGNFVRFRGRLRTFYFVNQPELVHDVLVTHAGATRKDRGLDLARLVLGDGLLTSRGTYHRRQRRLVAPAFHHQRIASYAESMRRLARGTSESWEDGREVDMSREMMRLTLAVVAKTLFDADVDDDADRIGGALDTVMGLFPRVTNPLAPLLNALPLPSTRRFFRAIEHIDTTIFRIVRERRDSGEDRGDLLSMLLAAQDEDDGSTMDDRQVRDEAMTLFIAGHETTANALTWTWYLLSQHPEVERRLEAEVDAEPGDDLSAIEWIGRLPYARQVLAESMRLYPPGHSFGRHVAEPFTLAGHRFVPGETLIVSPYVMHRDPTLWPDPERFDPDRWDPELEADRPRFAYFPFGGGPRTCIGESFAWAEGILLLATLVRRWRARLVPGHPVATQPAITLRIRHGMAMRVAARGRA